MSDRYHRTIEVFDRNIKPPSRYERIDRVFTDLFDIVFDGAALTVEAKGRRIQITFKDKGTWEYPSLEVGLRFIGDFLDGTTAEASPVDGDCTGSAAIDQEVLNGTVILAEKTSEDEIQVRLVRQLPLDNVPMKGGKAHVLVQRGTRVVVGKRTNLFELICSAVGSEERVERSSLIKRPPSQDP